MKKREIAVLLLHDGKGKVFLQKPKAQAFLPGVWSFFGGDILPGESAEQAIKREAERELGFTSHRPKFVISSRFLHGDVEVRLHLFTEKCEDNDLLILKEGYAGAWVSHQDLSTLNVLDHDKDLIHYTEKWLSAVHERYVVIILLYDEKFKFLLQKRSLDRSFLPGYWSTFGGGIEADEDPLVAVRREAKEELDYDLLDPDLVIEATFQHDSLRVYQYVYVKKCLDKSGLKLQEGENWGWYKINQLDNLKMLDHDRDVIRYIDKWAKRVAKIKSNS